MGTGPTWSFSDVTDGELLHIWRAARLGVAGLEERLTAALAAAGAGNLLWCEALAALAASPEQRLPM